MKYSNVKGTHDILKDEQRGYDYIETVFETIAANFCFDKIETPMMEYTDVFARGVGEGSDVVRKEMYTFLDKAGRSVTLRPEYTAGIVRMVISNKMYGNLNSPLKFSYFGPLFRYERPQLGRYREFHQFGVECIGNINYTNDAEVISMASIMLEALGLKKVTVKINTLGGMETRANYKKALVDYFSAHIDKMCDDCNERLKLNPLRILDCKDPNDQEIIAGAPKITDYLTKEDKKAFKETKALLKLLDVKYKVDTSLVRGLDYYSNTIFEFHFVSRKGVDYGAIGGGGHYSNLVKDLGGPELEGVGFSFGIERLYSLLVDNNILKEDKLGVNLYFMPLSQNEVSIALSLANYFRACGYRSEVALNKFKLAANLKEAERRNTDFAIIVAEEELHHESVVVKEMINQQQTIVEIKDLLTFFDKIYQVDRNEDNCHCHEEGHECHCHDDDNDDIN